MISVDAIVLIGLVLFAAGWAFGRADALDRQPPA